MYARQEIEIIYTRKRVLNNDMTINFPPDLVLLEIIRRGV